MASATSRATTSGGWPAPRSPSAQAAASTTAVSRLRAVASEIDFEPRDRELDGPRHHEPFGIGERGLEVVRRQRAEPGEGAECRSPDVGRWVVEPRPCRGLVSGMTSDDDLPKAVIQRLGGASADAVTTAIAMPIARRAPTTMVVIPMPKTAPMRRYQRGGRNGVPATALTGARPRRPGAAITGTSAADGAFSSLLASRPPSFVAG